MYFSSSFLFSLTIICTSVCQSQLIQRRDSLEDVYTNDFVASVVYNMSKEIVSCHGDSMELPNYQDTFEFAIFSGEFNAINGSLGNLSTFNIVNITVSTSQNSMIVFMQVKLDDLEISYTNFEASVRILSLVGSFNAVVGRNLLTIQVTLKLDDDNCETSLDIFKVEFGEIVLTINNESVSNSLLSRMASIVANRCTPEMESLAEEKLKKIVLPYISMVCEYWS